MLLRIVWLMTCLSFMYFSNCVLTFTKLCLFCMYVNSLAPNGILSCLYYRFLAFKLMTDDIGEDIVVSPISPFSTLCKGKNSTPLMKSRLAVSLRLCNHGLSAAANVFTTRNLSPRNTRTSSCNPRKYMRLLK